MTILAINTLCFITSIEVRPVLKGQRTVILNNGNQKFIFEYHDKERFLIVYSIIEGKAFTHYDKIDLSNFSDEELVYQGAKLHILEHEGKLDTLLREF